jgi:hypothetical protein
VSDLIATIYKLAVALVAVFVQTVGKIIRFAPLQIVGNRCEAEIFNMGGKFSRNTLRRFVFGFLCIFMKAKMMFCCSDSAFSFDAFLGKGSFLLLSKVSLFNVFIPIFKLIHVSPWVNNNLGHS